MTKFNFLRNSALFLILALISVSCLKDEKSLTGYGDAYILVEISGEDTIKGLGLHAFSYSDFSEVKVTSPENPPVEYNLEPYLGYKQDYYYESPLSDYAKTLPAAGSYLFQATFTDGSSMEFANELYEDYIFPPLIKTALFNKSSQSMHVTWAPVVYAHSFNVKLISNKGKILYVSAEFNNSADEHSFTLSSQGWLSGEVPSSGEEVIIEVTSYLKEKNAPQGRLQCIAKSRVPVIWD